jgi:acetate---CoA ligase (ADP-forming)
VANSSLDDLFYASSIAIVGASSSPRKASHQVIRTLLNEKYSGTIYPVHPTESEVLGLKCYASLRDIPGKVDLLVISIPARNVLDVMRDAVQRGDVRGAVILTAGFAETGDAELVKLEAEIIRIAREVGMRVVGPNCVGLINSANHLTTGFIPGLKIKEGRVGFITQSGALGGAFIMLAGDQPDPLGFSKFAHVGNMSDVTNLEALEYMGNDVETHVIGMYIEAVRHGREFLNLMRTISRRKPLFVLKVGRTEIGSGAAFSHTGSLAGSDAVYDGALKQGGAVRVDTLEEMIDSCKAAALLPVIPGKRICVLTEAGGPGIIAMDEIGRGGLLQMVRLSEATRDTLGKVLPSMAVVCKPEGYIDMTAAAMEREFGESVRLTLADPGVDMLFVIGLPPTFLPAVDVARAIIDAAHAQSKPVAACFMKGESMAEGRQLLEQNGIPTFDTPDRGIRALANCVKAIKGDEHA